MYRSTRDQANKRPIAHKARAKLEKLLLMKKCVLLCYCLDSAVNPMHFLSGIVFIITDSVYVINYNLHDSLLPLIFALFFEIMLIQLIYYKQIINHCYSFFSDCPIDLYICRPIFLFNFFPCLILFPPFPCPRGSFIISVIIICLSKTSLTRMLKFHNTPSHYSQKH